MWRVTIRSGADVAKSDHESLDVAIDVLEESCRAIANTSRRDAVKVARREFTPAMQVQARAELRGPGRTRAGVDVRGDGSVEAWVGRWRRQIVEQRKKESVYKALRRVLSSESVAP